MHSRIDAEGQVFVYNGPMAFAKISAFPSWGGQNFIHVDLPPMGISRAEALVLADALREFALRNP